MPIPQRQAENYPKTAKERVYSVMREWIVDGTLKPNEKIYDKEIADYFSVSRTPVREAFQMLAEQRLIVISPGKESRVAPVDSIAVRESYEILAALEALAVQFALRRCSPSALEGLKENTEILKRSISSGDARGAKETDRLFHEAILTLAGNDFLSRFCDTLETHVARMEYQFFSRCDASDLLMLSVNEHEQIISAIETGDEAAAMKAMSENWLHTIPYIETAFSAEWTGTD